MRAQDSRSNGVTIVSRSRVDVHDGATVGETGALPSDADVRDGPARSRPCASAVQVCTMSWDFAIAASVLLGAPMI